MLHSRKYSRNILLLYNNDNNNYYALLQEKSFGLSGFLAKGKFTDSNITASWTDLLVVILPVCSALLPEDSDTVHKFCSFFVKKLIYGLVIQNGLSDPPAI